MDMPQDTLLRNLSPERVVQAAAQMPFQDFLRLYGDTQFLLIQLDQLSNELAIGLMSTEMGADSRLKPSTNALAYHTVVASLDDLRTQEVAAVPGFTGTACRRLLLAKPHFCMPLRKRVKDASYKDRISVGRARNTDIVLRHPSVSKYHAWFGVDDLGRFYVADAGSKNGTLHNGTPLVAKELMGLSPGDNVRLGSVETTLCPAEVLWEALRQAAPSVGSTRR